MTPPTCATHPHVILRCLACAGAKGGKSTSPRKVWHARKNAKVAGAIPRKQCPLCAAFLRTPKPEETSFRCGRCRAEFVVEPVKP